MHGMHILCGMHACMYVCSQCNACIWCDVMCCVLLCCVELGCHVVHAVVYVFVRGMFMCAMHA